MAKKIYKRFGLRRDKNLSDVSDSQGALNNLLDTLVDVTGFTFISSDLDCIRNLGPEGMRNSNYREFVNSSTVQTNVDGLNETFFPRVTYQNKLDTFTLFSGEPRLRGGDGLTAAYFNTDQVFDKESTSLSAGTADDIFVGITTGGTLPNDQLWENGEFQYSGKIHPSSVNVGGGVKWEGFFIPTQSSQYTFTVSSTASFTFDFEDENFNNIGLSTYREYARVSAASTSACSYTIGQNSLTLTDAARSRFIAREMVVVGNSQIRAGSKVTGIDRTNGIITLENPDGAAILTTGSATTTFKRTFGDPVNISATTHTLIEGRRYRIRARFYIPQGVKAQTLERNIIFHVNRRGQSVRDLDFTDLYNLNYDFSDSAKGDVNKFLDNSIRFGGGEVGGNLQQNYVTVQSSKKIDIRYTPKTTFNDTITKSYSSGANISDTSSIVLVGSTTGVEVGNYAFANAGSGSLFANTRVQEVITNEAIILDKIPPTGVTDSNAALTLLNHRGFVRRDVNVNCSNGVLTLSTGQFLTLPGGSDTDLREGMLAFSSGGEIGAYTKVIDVTQTTCTLSPAPSNFIGRTIHFYQSRGLINDSLKTFCPTTTTFCRVLTADVNSGLNVLPINDTDNLAVNMKVQGSGIPNPGPGTPSAAETTITAIDPVGKTITLSANLTSLKKLGSTVTITSNAGDRQLCCPPTDTSPPFDPTENGLETRSVHKHLVITNGNIVFDDIKATVNENNYILFGQTKNNFSIYSDTDTANKGLTIQCPNGTFNALLNDPV